MIFTVYAVVNKRREIKQFYIDAMAEYAKRLGRFCKTSFVEIVGGVGTSGAARTFKVAVSNKGAAISSEEMAAFVKRVSMECPQGVDFVLGAGVSADVGYDLHIRITDMELDPGLTAVILYEQLYRAYKIISGERYHK